MAQLFRMHTGQAGIRAESRVEKSISPVLRGWNRAETSAGRPTMLPFTDVAPRQSRRGRAGPGGIARTR
jgi:hypothetical protein